MASPAASRRGSGSLDIVSDTDDLGDDVEEVFDGKIKLFDGPKTYPIQKIEVDYMFVEHLDFNCIEIIGKCQERQLEAPRIYIKAQELYDKTEADKKAKDKKNRRAEQVISKKIIRNMAVQSILVRLNIDRNAAFGLKLTAFDGINFQIPQPNDLVPHVINEKAVAGERRRSRSNSIGLTHKSTSNADVFGSTRGSIDGRHSIIGSINLMPEGVGVAASAMEIHEALEDLEEDAADLNVAAEHAKEQSSLFVNTIDNIKEMFDFRQKWREENGDPNKKTDLKKRRVLRNGRPVELKTEETREKHKKNRYSLTVKPQEGITLEQAQVVGREGAGGGPLTMIVGQSRTAAKTVSTGAAKAVLSAAGFVASNLAGKKVVAIGGQELKVVPKSINRRGSSVRVPTSSQAMSMLKKLGGSFKGLGSGSRDRDDSSSKDGGLTPADARQKVIDDLKASAPTLGGRKAGGVGGTGGGGVHTHGGDTAGVGPDGRRRNSDSQNSVLTKHMVGLAIDEGTETPAGNHFNGKERVASPVMGGGGGAQDQQRSRDTDAINPSSGTHRASKGDNGTGNHLLFNGYADRGDPHGQNAHHGSHAVDGGTSGYGSSNGGADRSHHNDAGAAAGGDFHYHDDVRGAQGNEGVSHARNQGSRRSLLGQSSGAAAGANYDGNANAYGNGSGGGVGVGGDGNLVPGVHGAHNSPTDLRPSGGAVKRGSLGGEGNDGGGAYAYGDGHSTGAGGEGDGAQGDGSRTPERRHGGTGSEHRGSMDSQHSDGKSHGAHATTTTSYTVKTVGLKLNPRKSLTGDPGVNVNNLVNGTTGTGPGSGTKTGAGTATPPKTIAASSPSQS